jgi:hypothetical protein
MSKTPMTETEKAMIDAIRSDPKIGRGTAAMVDECMDDSDLLEELRENGITDPEEAVANFKEDENAWREQADEALGAGGEKQIWGQV